MSICDFSDASGHSSLGIWDGVRQVTVPNLADVLLDDFTSGRTSAAKLGELARSAVQFCRGMGGTVPDGDLVQKIANIGCSGLHISNCERDLQVLMKQVSLKAKIEHIRIHINSAKEGSVVEIDLPVIFPDALAAALWESGEDIFRHYFLNDVNARQFWRHSAQHSQWFKNHPANLANHKKSHLIPLSLYGDEVSTYKNL